MIFKVFLLSILFSVTAQAQNYVIGYVQVEKIFAEWPEARRADTDLQEYKARLSSRLQAKAQDFQTKLASYEQNKQNMDAGSRQDAEAELQNLQTLVQQFEANAQQSVTERNASLPQPLRTKLKETIDRVAKESGYTHIFTYGSSLIFTADKSGDISKTVARKLGFTLSE